MTNWVGGGWGMLFHILSMILFWGLIIAGIVLLVHHHSPSSGTGASRSPLDILKARYARGEIEKEEFETKKRDILS